MPPDLLRQIRKAREGTVTVDGHTFTFLRPTDAQAMELHGKQIAPHEIARDYVTAWKDVTEADIVPNGTDAKVDFDRAVWSEWLADRPDFWIPISDAILSSYKRHVDGKEAAAKN